jgi:hypothetical protein
MEELFPLKLLSVYDEGALMRSLFFAFPKWTGIKEFGLSNLDKNVGKNKSIIFCEENLLLQVFTPIIGAFHTGKKCLDFNNFNSFFTSPNLSMNP